jgi:hypothetical protein
VLAQWLERLDGSTAPVGAVLHRSVVQQQAKEVLDRALRRP